MVEIASHTVTLCGMCGSLKPFRQAPAPGLIRAWTSSIMNEKTGQRPHDLLNV